MSGFTLPDDAFHAPDESFLVANLELGERAGRELLHDARAALNTEFRHKAAHSTRLAFRAGAPMGVSV